MFISTILKQLCNDMHIIKDWFLESGMYDIFSKGRERQTGQLKMLHAERDPDDGDAEQYTKKNMRQAYPYTTNENPNDVHNRIQASRRVFPADYVSSERPEGQTGKFKRLETEWYSYYGEHQHQTGYGIFYRNNDSPEYQPDDISNEVHDEILFVQELRVKRS